MKRWMLSLSLAMTMLLAACGSDGAADAPSAPTAAPTEPPTQLHTVAPSQSAPAVEWVSVDARLSLEDNHHVYAKNGDFICFALVGDSESAELRFKLDEATAEMLRGQPAGNAYYIAMNDRRIGDVALNESCDELTLIGDFTYLRLCELANLIRGLE